MYDYQVISVRFPKVNIHEIQIRLPHFGEKHILKILWIDLKIVDIFNNKAHLICKNLLSSQFSSISEQI